MHPNLFFLSKDCLVPLLEGFGMGVLAHVMGLLSRRVFSRPNRRRIVKALSNKNFPQRFAAIEVFLPKRTRKRVWHPAFHEALTCHAEASLHVNLRLLNGLFAVKMMWWTLVTFRFAVMEWILLLAAKEQSLYAEWTRMLSLRRRLVRSSQRVKHTGGLNLKYMHRFKIQFEGKTHEVRNLYDGIQSLIEMHPNITLAPGTSYEVKIIAFNGNRSLGANTLEIIVDKG